MPPLRKVLVANRGEIAIRILRACREMGLRTVAVYSAADANALHTKYADEAHPIGPPPASESYLNIPRILEVAGKTRADAIHPGYGFLAESADFARACEVRGVRFVGPPARVLEVMGPKLSAREAMARARIPVVPGSGALESVEEAVEAAEMLGWPAVLKPSGGGGGKGMRVVRDRKELEDAFESTKALAKSAFADPAVYLERFLPRPRHIEVQVLADRKGTTLHLFERECSIQRRFQKFMEEAPSPLLTPARRKTLTALAVKAARGVGYSNAGTLEFLWSGGRFYFGEMNPRLQVEHTVTEMVTGVDIVKTQLRVASGGSLGLRQADVELRGHAIQCRVMAEDPLTHAPSPGTIQGYRSPGGVGVRVDSGVHMGYTIPGFYDSLVAKVTVWGNDRPEAVARLQRALYEFIIDGVRTNIPLCKAVVAHPKFQKGDLGTDFLERNRIAEQVRSVLELEQSKALQMASIFAEGREEAFRAAVAMAAPPAPEPPEREEVVVVATAVQRYLETEVGGAKPPSRWLLESRRESVGGE
ncbi:MAG: acetyl-CoA carboxylase biotin carboxylase subunit [Halobacteria archaeon]